MQVEDEGGRCSWKRGRRENDVVGRSKREAGRGGGA